MNLNRIFCCNIPILQEKWPNFKNFCFWVFYKKNFWPHFYSYFFQFGKQFFFSLFLQFLKTCRHLMLDRALGTLAANDATSEI